MSKVTAKGQCLKCGRTFERVAYRRKRSECDAFKEWGEEKKNLNVCSACYRKEGDAMAQERASIQNLPELNGTEKQVEWAKKIRNFFVVNITNLYGKQSSMYEQMLEILPYAVEATVWIEYRNKSATNILNSLQRERRKERRRSC